RSGRGGAPPRPEAACRPAARAPSAPARRPSRRGGPGRRGRCRGSASAHPSSPPCPLEGPPGASGGTARLERGGLALALGLALRLELLHATLDQLALERAQ